MQKRTVAIDYGKKRIGLASADASLNIASPLPPLMVAKTHLLTIKALLALLDEKKITPQIFVIGLPLLLTGMESPMSTLVRQFGQLLEQVSNIQAVFYDERLTSAEIDHLMQRDKIRSKKRKAIIDGLAATVLLQTYLEQYSVYTNSPHYAKLS